MTDQGFLKAQSDNLPEVDSLMVAEFFSSSPLFTSAEQRVKAKRAERESYGDAAVGYVQLKRQNNICTVKCRICPEHRVRSKDYSVILEVNEQEKKILRAECQVCAASAGGCKHAIAFVMWVHRRSEDPSPTDVESYWKRPKLSGVGTSLKYLTVKDFSNKVALPTVPTQSNAFLEKFIEKGVQFGAASQIIQHYVEDKLTNLGIHQLLCSFTDEDERSSADEFLNYATLKMQLPDCVEAFEKTKSQSQCTLWHNLRYGRITASKIYDLSRCQTPGGTLVESIIGGLKTYDTPAMQRGKEMESTVLHTLEKKLKIKLQRGGLMLLPQYPAFGASPDGFCDDFVVEIKCPFSDKTVSNYITKENAIKDKYRAQIHLQMLLMKKNQGVFCVADPLFEQNNKINIINVTYYEQFIMSVMENSLLFWKQSIFPVIQNM